MTTVANIRVSAHPLFQEKLTQLRDRSLRPSAVRSLVAQMTSIIAVEATSGIHSSLPTKTALIVVLRSGLAMADPFLAQLETESNSVVTYHLGLFREKETLEPVEYYNKLPAKDSRIKHAFIIDPLIATGGTAAATIGILKDWGVEKVTFISLLASKAGLERLSNVWPEGTQFYVGAVDNDLDSHGYIQPGVGDIGDRLFGTNLS
ncbi:uracil phosphoribosyltransferase [Bisporella sp. PMI_857]|nr:uracil phosphoribosyltransferase [Bisporella sp. PMI_857]